ncbi:MAG: hypothetical protein HYT69_01705 [Candidatus Zambryskibacteria bacterium]|nr:hypothetical protein [Candidatus Zambryskibacteria bacterium]
MAKEEGDIAWIGVAVLLFVLIIITTLPYFFKITYSAEPISSENFPASSGSELVTHLPTPDSLKALYMTACVAATPSWREGLTDLIDTTELNSIIIDIKDYSGNISFETSANCYIKDLKEFIGELHEARIYVIGRITVFQDPYYANLHPELSVRSKSSGGVWKDYKGLSFIDVGARPYWDYILEISKEAYELGFDELNYDYVRYPSDGNMEDAQLSWTVSTSTKAEMLESFFSYLRDQLKDTGVKTSVDLFGMTTTVESDMNIGQILERTLPYFDFVSPMVYPSHYPPTWNGFVNPAEYPYEVVKISITRAIEREQALNILNGLATSTPSKFRPWLQDFNLGATYDASKVRAQIQATYDTGLTSWMLWSAANKYTEEALLPN